MHISIDRIREIIQDTRPDTSRKGRAFKVVFTKQNGERREMRARLGVTKGVTGKGQSYNPADHGLVTVWELANGFRNIPLDRLVSLRVPDNHKHLREAIPAGAYISRFPL